MHVSVKMVHDYLAMRHPHLKDDPQFQLLTTMANTRAIGTQGIDATDMTPEKWASLMKPVTVAPKATNAAPAAPAKPATPVAGAPQVSSSPAPSAPSGASQPTTEKK